MNDVKAYDFFYQQRWPNGYVCSRCNHRACYIITTRKMPLYQCRFCRYQTTLTAGTLMDRSRTPLSKWAEAIELLSSTRGVNGVQLARAIQVTHKTAWNMLRKFRRAISAFDAEQKLGGTVHAGVRSLGRYMYVPYARYDKEQVVLIGASMNGGPAELKMKVIADEHLIDKRITSRGANQFFAEHADPDAEKTLLPHMRMITSPVRGCFERAALWLKKLYGGLGPSYLQSYLDEYCFRSNVANRQLSPREEWAKLTFRQA